MAFSYTTHVVCAGQDEEDEGEQENHSANTSGDSTMPEWRRQLRNQRQKLRRRRRWAVRRLRIFTTKVGLSNDVQKIHESIEVPSTLVYLGQKV